MKKKKLKNKKTEQKIPKKTVKKSIEKKLKKETEMPNTVETKTPNTIIEKIIELISVYKRKFIQSSLKIKIIILVVLLGLGFGTWKVFGQSGVEETTYETETAQVGTLITSISGSGSITSGNYTNISTKVSGTVTTVYVTNGDYVSQGDKIAEVELDDYASERQTAAWVEYLEAKENVDRAIANKETADIEMWQARQAVMNAQDDLDELEDGGNNPATDEVYTDEEMAIIRKTLVQKQKAFTAAESKYLNADADISYSRTKVTAAWRDYQENSSTIYAPADGEISDLALAEGTLVSASSSQSTSTGATIVSAQTVGKINDTEGQLVATVNLTELDVISVEANQKVTITFDVYEDQTFTGKVMAVNTSGSVSSGVTSYPVTILLDPVNVDVYPNMAVSVEIITNIATDVVLVPSTAVQTLGDQDIVEIMKDGEVTEVQVEVGDSNDSYTIIVSGIEEGDEVVSSSITVSSSDDDDEESSPFTSSGFGGGRSGMTGGGAPPGGF